MTGKWFGFEWKEVFDEAVGLFERNDFEEASKAFEVCQAADDGDPLLNRYLGKCYEALANQALIDEEFSAAAANAENALIINPGYPDLHVLAARAYSGLGTMALAQRHLQKALLLHPGYVQAKELLDTIQGGSAVVQCHAESHAAYLVTIGDKCLKEGLNEEALAVFLKADQLTPDHADICYRIAMAQFAMGHEDESEISLLRCLQLNGSYSEALHALGNLKQIRGETVSAERLSQRASALDSLTVHIA